MPLNIPIGGTLAIGYPWSKAYGFPAGALQAGDALRMEFRRAPTDPEPVASIGTGAGILADGDTLFLTMTERQTARFTPGRFISSFALTRGGIEYPLSQTFDVEAELKATRAV